MLFFSQQRNSITQIKCNQSESYHFSPYSSLSWSSLFSCKIVIKQIELSNLISFFNENPQKKMQTLFSPLYWHSLCCNMFFSSYKVACVFFCYCLWKGVYFSYGQPIIIMILTVTCNVSPFSFWQPRSRWCYSTL